MMRKYEITIADRACAHLAVRAFDSPPWVRPAVRPLVRESGNVGLSENGCRPRSRLRNRKGNLGLLMAFFCVGLLILHPLGDSHRHAESIPGRVAGLSQAFFVRQASLRKLDSHYAVA